MVVLYLDYTISASVFPPRSQKRLPSRSLPGKGVFATLSRFSWLGRRAAGGGVDFLG
jgi:hypothetical protein